MSVKNFIFKNLGLRIVALFLAVFVWAMISGKERSQSTKTLDVNVEYYGVPPHIDIRGVNPDSVRVKVEGTSRELEKLAVEDIRIRLNLNIIKESTLISLYTGDVLEYPEPIKIISVHPKRIEITAVEMVTREVPIRVRYKGKLKPGIVLVERRLTPETAKILGYKSQIDDIKTVEAIDWVNLSEIEESQVIEIPLKKEKEILKFQGAGTVNVHITIENKKKETDDEKNGNP
jgi:YbbR domain-containing protein